jgi:hypothetical protein
MRIIALLVTLLVGIGIGSWLFLTGKLTIANTPTGNVIVVGKGQFKGNVKAEFLAPNNPTNTFRDIRLTAPFGYVDKKGIHWDVPAGYVTNGASIPASLWGIVGGPFDGPYRDAAVIHDYYCEAKSRTSDETHEMYYEAAIARGTSEAIAKTMYAGILLGGPTWQIAPKKAGFDVFAQGTGPTVTTPSGATVKVDQGLVNKSATPDQLKAAEEIKAWIARENPSIEQIKKRAEDMRKSTGITK